MFPRRAASIFLGLSASAASVALYKSSAYLNRMVIFTPSFQTRPRYFLYFYFITLFHLFFPTPKFIFTGKSEQQSSVMTSPTLAASSPRTFASNVSLPAPQFPPASIFSHIMTLNSDSIASPPTSSPMTSSSPLGILASTMSEGTSTIFENASSIARFCSHVPVLTRENHVFSGPFPRSALTYSIIGTNLAVFLAWQPEKLAYFMNKNFTSSTEGVFTYKRYHTLLTSAFSHAAPLHFLFNNIALYSILPQLERIWGFSKAATIYISSAIVSTGLYLGLHRTIENVARKNNRLTPTLRSALRVPSLGASGVIASLFVCYANMFPHAKFNIMFIPYPIDALTLMSAFALFDTVGFFTMLYRGYGFMNLCHSAHLAGYLTGLLIYKFADPYNKKRRQALARRTW